MKKFLFIIIAISAWLMSPPLAADNPAEKGTVFTELAKGSTTRNLKNYENSYENPSLKAAAKVEPVMVREDRVWTYEQIGLVPNATLTDSEWDVVNKIQLQFCGTTEIDGLVYSNLYARKAGDPLDTDDNMLFVYAREDNGRVYIYNDGSLPECPRCYPYEDYPFAEGFCNPSHPEALIYDFGLRAGESYRLYPEEYASSALFSPGFTLALEPWKVISTDLFTLSDGRQVTRQTIEVVESESEATFKGEVVEELGYMHNLWPYPFITRPVADGIKAARLLKLTDTDGNVLFERPSAVVSVGDVILNSAASETGRYTIDGRRMSATAKGWCIIRYSDGSARKVYVK